ncbi:hypothetical protein JHL17_19695 [Azospirillum sp. YIM B02556]|uniref:LysR substrate binding domain-containing protein n=1 Tax=Azospirillum endophyticum TaxID=2800326 RepID=A0ABS1F8C4_9PROT|nr:hypothetical protein [Azospirillum endophyticum]MBK1839637.1 hypothetical protein [Azospirillum endophyticum]
MTIREAALPGLGITLLAAPDVLSHLERGDLQAFRRNCLAERFAGSLG